MAITSFDRVNASLVVLSAAQAATAIEMKKLMATVASVDKQIAGTDSHLEKLMATVAQTGKQIAGTDSQLEKLMATVASVGKQLGGMAKNQGDITEEFFYNSLSANPVVGDIKFDRVTPNLIVGTKKRQSEFDMVLTNGNSVALLEVKNKAHLSDLDQVEAQIKRYRELCPEFKTYKLYGGIAGFSVPNDVVKAAHARGLFVLKRKGDVMSSDAKAMRAF